MNYDADFTRSLLKCAEYGSCPKFQFVAREDDRLTFVDDAAYYASYYKRWMDSAAEAYAFLNELLTPVQNARMINHVCISDGVYRTELDGLHGRIRRTPHSAIRDYTENVFYGQETFNHEPYNGRWGSYPFMVYISYIYEDGYNQRVEDDARSITCALSPARPERTLHRLCSGEEITYMVYGDSISAGCEALYEKDTYFARFADRLQRVTGGTVHLSNESIGGETSREGVARFAAALEKHCPSLVSIAYGMNDMCVKSDRPADLTVEQYLANIQTMLNMARSLEVEVILITNCLPNPRWCYTSSNHKAYAAGLRTLAQKEKVPLADVQALWERELAHGKRLCDLLLNDVNHPTSYGHYLYAAMLETLI